MRRWSVWAASAIGAVGAGAGLAVARRRRPTDTTGAGPPPPPPPPPEDPPLTPPPGGAGDDAQAALDAARTRLRERADRLRRDIEAAGGHPPGGG